MNLCKLIFYDIKEGIIKQWPKYVLEVFLLYFISWYFFHLVSINRDTGLIQNIPSTLDCFVYLFRGMEIYVPSPDKPFMVPVLWLLFNGYLAFVVAGYPSKDLYHFGLHLLIRSESRIKWWISKCIWNIINVCFYYFIAFFTVSIASIQFGKFGLVLSEQIARLISEVNLIQSKGILFYLFTIPLAMSLALSLVQMLVEFLFRPIFGVLVIVVILVSSAYYFSPFLIGNTSMILRSEFVLTNGIKTSFSLTFLWVIVCFLIFVGCFYFRKKDILEK